jgi:hypothetical protein
MPEHWIIGVELLLGFLWIRTRARDLGEGAGLKAIVGVFFVLGPLLLAEKWLFDRLPFQRLTNLAVALITLAASFWLTGTLFLRGEKARDSGVENAAD